MRNIGNVFCVLLANSDIVFFFVFLLRLCLVPVTYDCCSVWRFSMRPSTACGIVLMMSCFCLSFGSCLGRFRRSRRTSQKHLRIPEMSPSHCRDLVHLVRLDRHFVRSRKHSARSNILELDLVELSLCLTTYTMSPMGRAVVRARCLRSLSLSSPGLSRSLSLC